MSLAFGPSFACSLALVLIATWVASRRRPSNLLLLLLVGAVLSAHVALYWRFTVDDSFITYRYARNWAEGLGPVYQRGERIEGCTSLGWTGLLALATRLGLDTDRAAKGIGLVCALLTLPAALGLARRATPHARAGWISPFALAVSPLFAAWACAGMEAPLFAALLAWAVWRHVIDSEGERTFPLGAMLFGLLVWVRPEGVLFATAGLLSHLTGPEPIRDRARGALRFGLAAAAVAVPFWIGRWTYYGRFFPNTFYAKTTAHTAHFTQGIHSLADLAAYLGAGFLALALLPVLRARWKEPIWRTLWLTVGSYLVYVAAIGGDVLHLRVYVHVLPLLAVCASAGAGIVATALESLRPVLAHRRAAWLAVMLGVGWVAFAYERDAVALGARDQFGAAYVVQNASNIQDANIPLGRWLATNAGPNALLATWDIGGIGYYSRLPIVDLYGLTDSTLARLHHEGASNRECALYLERRSPELIVTYGTRDGALLGWMDRDWINANYIGHSAWQNHTGGALVLFQRKDIQLPPGP